MGMLTAYVPRLDTTSCLSMPYVLTALAWRINEREHKSAALVPAPVRWKLIEGETLFSWLHEI